MPASPDEEHLRQAAALWFARRRGPDATAHEGAFEAWMGDADHRRAYERLEQRWAESAVLAQAVRPGLARRVSRRSPPRRSGVLAPFALAGLAACALVIAILAWEGPNLGPGLADLDPLARRASTQVGEIKTIQLGDGDSLTLDTNSAVLIRVAAGERHVRLLRGRGRFSLTARSPRPLLVDAGQIRVRGGQGAFDVEIAPAERVEIALLDGIVDVVASPWARPRRGAPRPHVGLAPGQVISLAGDRTVVRTVAMNALSRGWPSGWLSLENTPLSEVIATANRYSVHKIEIDDDALAALRVTGAFRATAPRRLADGLAAAFHLQVDDTPGGGLRLSRPDI